MGVDRRAATLTINCPWNHSETGAQSDLVALAKAGAGEVYLRKSSGVVARPAAAAAASGNLLERQMLSS